MRRFNTSLILLLFNVLVTAQTLSVESFRLLENDLAANTQGTMMRDQNGDVAALIRVVTSEKGFVFDGGMMGIVGTKQDVGEILLYVPHGIQKITIKHDQLGVLRDYYFPIPIEKARTYEMKLLSGRVKTVIEDEFAAQYATFRVEPKNAIVYIDGTAYTAQTDGTVSQLLTYGTHEYRVELLGYKTEAGVVEIGSEKIVKDVTLKSTMSTITIQCGMEEADIYVNDEKKGQGSWTGQLAPGLYKVETKRDYYQSRVQSLTVGESEVRTVSMPDPLPQYGRVQIQTTPIDATVFIDGEEVGTTPLFKSELSAGIHHVFITLDDYYDYSTDIVVLGSEMTELSVPLQFDAEQSARKERERLREEARIEREKQKEQALIEKEERKANRVFFKSNSIYGGSFINMSQNLEPSLGFQIGGYLKNINLEAAYMMVEPDVESRMSGYWTMIPEDLNGDGVIDESEGLTSYSYRYELSEEQLYVRAGYGIQFGRRLRITPQIGVMYQKIIKNYDYSCNVFEGDRRTYAMCAQMDAKVEFSPLCHVSIYCTPGYTIPFKLGQIATKINENGNGVNELLGGLYLNAGVCLYF